MYRSFANSNCSNGKCACACSTRKGKVPIFFLQHCSVPDAHSHIIVCIVPEKKNSVHRKYRKKMVIHYTFAIPSKWLTYSTLLMLPISPVQIWDTGNYPVENIQYMSQNSLHDSVCIPLCHSFFVLKVERFEYTKICKLFLLAYFTDKCWRRPRQNTLFGFVPLSYTVSGDRSHTFRLWMLWDKANCKITFASIENEANRSIAKSIVIVFKTFTGMIIRLYVLHRYCQMARSVEWEEKI